MKAEQKHIDHAKRLLHFPREIDLVNKVMELVQDEGKPRTTVNGESMTVEAAQKLFEQTKETHDWKYCGWGEVTKTVFTYCPDFDLIEGYTYTPKKLKLIDWSKMPVGVAVKSKKTAVVWTFQGVNGAGGALLTEVPDGFADCAWYDISAFELAPASPPKWIVSFGTNPTQRFALIGLDVSSQYVSGEMWVFKVNGVADGYTDGGAA